MQRATFMPITVSGESNGPGVRWASPTMAVRVPYASLAPGMFVVREDRVGIGFLRVLHPITRRFEDGSWEMQGVANARPDIEHLTEANYIGVAYPLDAK